MAVLQSLTATGRTLSDTVRRLLASIPWGSLHSTFPLPPISDPSSILVQNEIEHVDLKLDLWLFPFLNVFGIYGSIDGRTTIDLSSVGIPLLDSVARPERYRTASTRHAAGMPWRPDATTYGVQLAHAPTPPRWRVAADTRRPRHVVAWTALL